MNSLAWGRCHSLAKVRVAAPAKLQAPARIPVVRVQAERFRLNNVGPAPGSRREEARKGRGHAAGQVCACVRACVHALRALMDDVM